MSLAVDAVESLIAALSSIVELENKTFHILTEEELENRAKAITYPAAGVVYEGLESDPSIPKPPGFSGQAVRLRASIILFYKGAAGIGRLAADKYKPEALDLLDSIRTTIRATRGPNNMFWTFDSELAAEDSKGIIIWVQRWSIPALLEKATTS